MSKNGINKNNIEKSKGCLSNRKIKKETIIKRSMSVRSFFSYSKQYNITEEAGMKSNNGKSGISIKLQLFSVDINFLASGSKFHRKVSSVQFLLHPSRTSEGAERNS